MKVQYFCVLIRTGTLTNGMLGKSQFIDVVDVVSADVTAKKVFDDLVELSNAQMAEKGARFTEDVSVQCWSMRRNDLGLEA